MNSNSSSRLRKSISGVTISLGPVSFPVQMFTKLLMKLVPQRKNSRLKDCPSNVAAHALISAVSFILKDRVVEGPGAGGWGKSDANYVAYLYGDDDTVTDSVMTTVVVMEALDGFMKLKDSLDDSNEVFKREWWDNTIRKDVNTYAKKRWNTRTGEGGTLKQGREGDFVLTPRYRHTAWLIRLWLILPGTYKNIDPSVRAISEGFEDIIWEDEKIATPVAAYAALRALAGHNWTNSTLTKERNDFLQRALLDLIKSKYRPDICGWTSGVDLIKGRNIYSSFVFAELASEWDYLDEELRGMLNDFLHLIMESSHPYSKGGKYIIVCDNGEIDINSTCLIYAALDRKPYLNNIERRFFKDITKYLTQEFTTNTSNIYSDLFAWTISYFVAGMCGLLKGRAREQTIDLKKITH